ncbi:TPA: ead/Ea22-like family protein [Pseudomonas aeruginosa]
MDTNKLKELAERATPGPWTLYVPENYQGPEELPGYGVECAEGHAIVWGALEPETGCQFDRDAEFIAAANPAAVLELIAEVERIKAENEALLLGMRAILNAYDYADQYNKEGVAVEVMEDLRTLFKGATQ